jgi:hypothetical protein
MWQSVALAFIAGVFLGNGIPHFVKGITKESYPCVLGNSAVPNLIGGWLSVVIAGLIARSADLTDFPDASLISASVGLLAIGLFHASIGAFGRKT